VRGGVGEGVEIGFGGDNSLVNHGTITSESGTAILANVGNETIENHGRILGLTDLGSGNNVINSFGDTAANSPVIVTGNRDDVVNNSSTITGDVDLGGGNNEFNNLAGGICNAGTAVSLGVGNSFINFGHIEPGGRRFDPDDGPLAPRAGGWLFGI
jgi:hypothetical protein